VPEESKRSSAFLRTRGQASNVTHVLTWKAALLLRIIRKKMDPILESETATCGPIESRFTFDLLGRSKMRLEIRNSSGSTLLRNANLHPPRERNSKRKLLSTARKRASKSQKRINRSSAASGTDSTKSRGAGGAENVEPSDSLLAGRKEGALTKSSAREAYITRRRRADVRELKISLREPRARARLGACLLYFRSFLRSTRRHRHGDVVVKTAAAQGRSG